MTQCVKDRFLLASRSRTAQGQGPKAEAEASPRQVSGRNLREGVNYGGWGAPSLTGYVGVPRGSGVAMGLSALKTLILPLATRRTRLNSLDKPLYA